MKKYMKILAVLVALALVACIATGFGSRVAEHSSTYFKQLTDVLETAVASAKVDRNPAPKEPVVNENMLATPANLKVAADGTYSFDAVAGAQYYVVYVYESEKSMDATGQSDKIMEDGSATYSGNVSEFANLGFEEWNVRVIAYPDYASGDKQASHEASTSYIIKGEVNHGNPKVASMWNVTTNTLTVKLEGMDYGRTAYPIDVKLTLTNTADANDVVTVDLGAVSASSATAATNAVKADAVYTVKADLVWDANYVTNPTFTVSGGQAETSSVKNLLNGEFNYSSHIFHTMDFPHVCVDFDPVKGGNAGVWNNTASSNSGGWGMPQQQTTTDTDNDVYYEAIPKAAVDGAVYSYDVEITSPSGSITASPKLSPGSGSTDIIWGTLDCYPDGSFKMEIEYQYMKTDAMNSAVYYVPGVICDGSWVDNGNGTWTLSYDHENAYETDYIITDELTGKAAAYAEANPEWKSSQNQMGGFPGGGFPGFPGSGGDTAVTEWTLLPESTSFERGAASFAFKLGGHQYYSTTANLEPIASEGSTYTSKMVKGDPNAPFDVEMTLELKANGEAVVTVGSAGPITGGTVIGTWNETDGMINLIF